VMMLLPMIELLLQKGADAMHSVFQRQRRGQGELLISWLSMDNSIETETHRANRQS